jgi:hypothetical protein
MKSLGRHLAWSLFLLIEYCLCASAVPAVVRPRARAITPQEIRATIERALAARGLATEAHAIGERLTFGVPVFVTRDDAALEVTDVRCEPSSNKTLFRLRAAGDPQTLPFFVMAEGCAEALTKPFPGPRSAMPIARSMSHFRRAQRRPRAQNRPVLAEPGKPAKLVVEGEGFRISTRVMPLERGAEGQQIRVRALDSRRVMKVRVIGPALVAAAP